MSKKGLKAWVKEKWVDIGAPKKDGKYQPCGRKKGSKRKYPKAVWGIASETNSMRMSEMLVMMLPAVISCI